MRDSDVFIFEPVGFFLREVNRPLDARSNESLALAAAINGRFRAGLEKFIHLVTDSFLINVQFVQDLRDHTLWLFKQRQQKVFSINLVMPVALQDFIGSCRCILRTLGKTIKSHHNILSLWSSLSSTHLQTHRLTPMPIARHPTPMFLPE